jgi:CRISPR/Cas system-associated exonuclease Cas4 (RecB family)
MWNRIVSEMSAGYPVLGDPRFSAPLARLRMDMLNVSILQDEIEARADAAGLERIAVKLEQPLPAYVLQNVSFSGKTDRIDIWRTPSGPAAVIVDYKLGASGRYLGSLQLASYAVMMARAGCGGAGAPRVAGFCYIGHADSCARGGLSSELEQVYAGKSRRRGFDLKESVAAAAGVMDEMDAGLASGRFPARYDSDNCDACAYQTLCRRSERLGFYESREDAAVEGQGE